MAEPTTDRTTDTRTISLYHVHTHEALTVTYKRNGEYVPEAMAKVDSFMRDWRMNKTIKMDPHSIDLIWEMHAELGSKEPINVIKGYQSPETNGIVAESEDHLRKLNKSENTAGTAISVTFPDVPLKQLRYWAIAREQGGVGYYPTSSIPFVHVDTGKVRHWPRLPRYELALLFPDGNTKHRPASEVTGTDGPPINLKDVREAKIKHPDLAQEVAALQARATLVMAEAKPKEPVIVVAATVPPVQPERGVKVLTWADAYARFAEMLSEAIVGPQQIVPPVTAPKHPALSAIPGTIVTKDAPRGLEAGAARRNPSEYYPAVATTAEPARASQPAFTAKALRPNPASETPVKVALHPDAPPTPTSKTSTKEPEHLDLVDRLNGTVLSPKDIVRLQRGNHRGLTTETIKEFQKLIDAKVTGKIDDGTREKQRQFKGDVQAFEKERKIYKKDIIIDSGLAGKQVKEEAEKLKKTRGLETAAVATGAKSSMSGPL